MKFLTARVSSFIAVLLLLMSHSVSAITLGDATVFSHLEQPIYAEIPLHGVSRFEIPNIELSLAAKSQFERMQMSYDEKLEKLSFLPVKRGDGWYIQVHTVEKLGMPVVAFPLKMKWAEGQVIRGYTFVLKPAPDGKPLIADPARVSSGADSSGSRAERIFENFTAQKQESYGPVKSGETLWPIANKLRDQNMSVEQMAMALLKANPEAFHDGNVNKLKRGVNLKVPSREDVMSMTAREARAAFYAQVNSWKEEIQQARLAKEQAIAEQKRLEEEKRLAEERRIAEEKARIAAEEKAKAEAEAARIAEEEARKLAEEEARRKAEEEQQSLSIVPAADDNNPDTKQEFENEVLRTMEEVEANRLANEQFQERIDDLAEELEDVQTLVTLKDQQLANLQDLVEESKRELEISKEEAMQAIAEAPTNAIKRYIEEQQRIADEARPEWQKWLDREFGIRVSTEQVWQYAALAALVVITILLLMLLRSKSRQSEIVAAQTTVVDKEDLKEELQQEYDHKPRVAFSPLVYDIKNEKEKTSAEEADDSADPKRINVQSWVSQLHEDAAVVAKSLRTDSETREELTDKSANRLSMTHEDEEPGAIPNMSPHDHDDKEIALDDAVEMNLDLAKAYSDLGDNEGARNLLNESRNQTDDPILLKRIEDMLKRLDD